MNTCHIKEITGKKNYIYSGITGALIEKTPYVNGFINGDIDDCELDYLLNKKTNITTSVNNKPIIKSIAIFTTIDCNLRCKYCYQKDMELGEQKKSNEYLDRILSFIQSSITSGHIKNHLSIQFFGGEPLVNFSFIEKATNYLNQLQQQCDLSVSYGLTTNGTIFTKRIIRFLTANRFSITVSVDGNKKNHDANRIFSNGSGTFDSIRNNLRKLPAKIKPTARMTLTLPDSGTQDFVSLFDLGFYSVSYDVNFDKLVTMADAELYLESFSKDIFNFYKKRVIQGKYVRIINIFNLLRKIDNMSVQQVPCGAGYNYFSFYIDGNLYSCHRLVDNVKHKFSSKNGHISKGEVVTFSEEVQQTKDKLRCINCWAHSLCGGACYYDSATNINKLNCYYVKSQCQQALDLYIEMKELYGPEWTPEVLY